jgi:hypothetical protein
MSHRRLASLALSLGLSLTAGIVAAQTMIFKWIDTKGTLHVTDRLADVPEPYYAMYRAKLKASEEQQAKGGGAAATSSPTPVVAPPAVESSEASSPAPSLVDEELRRQAEWKALVALWRERLAIATAEVEAIQSELEEATLNPILRETPAVKAQAAAIEVRRGAAMSRLEAARKMLLVELPARARKEGVPPRWLE